MPSSPAPPPPAASPGLLNSTNHLPRLHPDGTDAGHNDARRRGDNQRRDLGDRAAVANGQQGVALSVALLHAHSVAAIRRPAARRPR